MENAIVMIVKMNNAQFENNRHKKPDKGIYQYLRQKEVVCEIVSAQWMSLVRAQWRVVTRMVESLGRWWSGMGEYMPWIDSTMVISMVLSL